MKKSALILSIMIVCCTTGFSQQSPPLIKDPPLHQPPVLEDHSKYDKDEHANKGHYKQHRYKWKKRYFRRNR